MQLTLNSEFQSFGAEIGKERQERVDSGSGLLTFGTQFLDEALGGIAAKDLIVVASKTGRGKTQLVTHMALANVLRGRRVHFFALEAERFEIERRIKYQIIASKFFQSSTRAPIHLNYLDWYYGRLDSAVEKYEQEADEELIKYKNLFVFYRKDEFNSREFQRLALSVKNETDLMIIDHLHYFDFDDDNENRAMKETVKTIRDTALLSGKPVVLVSHVRKTDRKFKQIIPDVEDLHGSSDIGKIATKIITIAPVKDNVEPDIKQTYIGIAKCRIDGARNDIVARLGYNLSTQRYEDSYAIGRVSLDGSEFEETMANDIPFWAKSAIERSRVSLFAEKIF